MTKYRGNRPGKLALIALLTAVLGAPFARGEVTAALDRHTIALSDTVRLTITATESEDIGDIDLQPLLGDFEIVQRASSSSTSIVNGRMSRTRQMTIDLLPRREGTLRIPPLQAGTVRTDELVVVVQATQEPPDAEQLVAFEAEVDREHVYVQGQVILTLRVSQAVNLENRSISHLQIDNAFVKPLEQHSYQRSMHGRTWLVDELRYAIFPEQSGTLEIPPQVFSGRMYHGRRNLFDLGGSSQLLRRGSPAIRIEVLPRPAEFPDGEWLPARNLVLRESWSTSPERLRVGESATRTIEIIGEGLQGAQLPPVLFTPIDGLKLYPDQPRISEQETDTGLEGLREDSVAIVASRPGSHVIPEIRIPWWDTQSEQLRYATLPQREITVTGMAADSTAPPPPTVPARAPDVPGTAESGPAVRPRQVAWQIVSAVSTFGWLLTLALLWRIRTRANEAPAAAPENHSEKKAFGQLLAACASADASAARGALLRWAALFFPPPRPATLDQLGERCGDGELQRELAALNASLYRPGAGAWCGDGLAATVKRLRAEHGAGQATDADEIRLYPLPR